jgi:hypothetical protein
MVFSKKIFWAFILMGMITIPASGSHAAPGPQIVGTWLCSAVRAATILRPIIYTFHADGTFNYSSGTTVNNSTDPLNPLFDSGIHSRGEAWGNWQKTAPNVFSAQNVEILRDVNGSAWGVFNVSENFLLTSSGQLCSGINTPNPDVWGSDVTCPNQSLTFDLIKFIFDQDNVDKKITDSDSILSGNANALCNRLGSGEGFPGVPVNGLP